MDNERSLMWRRPLDKCLYAPYASTCNYGIAEYVDTIVLHVLQIDNTVTI